MPITSPSVLLIRLDGIGDALALCPLLAALRAANIPVDAVLSTGNIDAFAPGALRERWAAPFALRDTGHANLAAIAAFGVTLAQRGYTHALVATEDPGGYRLAHASGVPHRIGFANGWGKPFKTIWVRSLLTQTLYRPAGLDSRAPHECEVLFELGRPILGLGAKPTRDLGMLRPLVIDNDPPRDSRIGFQVTDKWERLGISFEEVVACVRALAPNSIRAFGSSAESEYAARFSRATSLDIELFATVSDWKAAIAGASVLVAPDGGAIHVAGMVGTPVVALFTSQPNFASQSARWSPWAAPFEILEARVGWPETAAKCALALRANLNPG
jgi:ADP-heptose:LPS heptosyltransferase